MEFFIISLIKIALVLFVISTVINIVGKLVINRMVEA